jgi:hypothetical protein
MYKQMLIGVILAAPVMALAAPSATPAAKAATPAVVIPPSQQQTSRGAAMKQMAICTSQVNKVTRTERQQAMQVCMRSPTGR